LAKEPYKGDRLDCLAQLYIKSRPIIYLTRLSQEASGQLRENMSASKPSNEIKQQVADSYSFWQSIVFSEGIAL